MPLVGVTPHIFEPIDQLALNPPIAERFLE
jgi:hypothetical protein